MLTPKHLPILFRDITAFGGAFFFGMVTILAFLLQQYQLGMDLILGFFFSLAVIVAIRMLYFKDRPHKQTYSNILERIDASSFPSWHTARAFFLAILLGNYFADRFIYLFLMLLAIVVAYSRIYLKKHDGIDVIGGIVLAGVTYGIIILI